MCDLSVSDCPAGQQEVIVTRGAAAEVWMVIRDVTYGEVSGHDGAVISLAVSDRPNGSQVNEASEPTGEVAIIYSASIDNTIRAWDAYDMAQLSVHHETKSAISCLRVSALYDFVIAGNEDGSIRLWNTDSGSTMSLLGHSNTICCIDIARRGSSTVLLSSGYDGHVGVWDISTRKVAMPRLEQMVKAHELEVLCLQADPMMADKGGTFITAGNDRQIHIWSMTTFKRLARLQGHRDAVTALALDGNVLLSGAEDGVVNLWDLHSYMALSSLQVHKSPIESLLLVPDNGLLITCSTDKTIRVWDYSVGREVHVWYHSEEFRCIALNRSVSTILAGTEQGHIVSFSLGEPLAMLRRP